MHSAGVWPYGAAIAACFALVACQSERLQLPVPESQVAARVNDGDITVHQVQTIMRLGQKASAEHFEASAQRALAVLVEQELAAQAARSQGLDKDPQVLQLLEAARRDVLARAYQDRIAEQVTRASSTEIDRFYESHPELFAERRIYTLREDVIDAPLERVASLFGKAQAAHRIDDKLAATGLSYRTRIYAQAAEDMPVALLQKIHPLAPGQALLLQQPAGVRLFVVLHAQPAPVNRQVAVPSIDTFLSTDRRRREVEAKMKSLRDGASIAYSSAFAASAPLSEPVTTR